MGATCRVALSHGDAAASTFSESADARASSSSFSDTVCTSSASKFRLVIGRCVSWGGELASGAPPLLGIKKKTLDRSRLNQREPTRGLHVATRLKAKLAFWQDTSSTRAAQIFTWEALPLSPVTGVAPGLRSQVSKTERRNASPKGQKGAGRSGSGLLKTSSSKSGGL